MKTLQKIKLTKICKSNLEYRQMKDLLAVRVLVDVTEVVQRLTIEMLITLHIHHIVVLTGLMPSGIVDLLIYLI